MMLSMHTGSPWEHRYDLVHEVDRRGTVLCLLIERSLGGDKVADISNVHTNLDLSGGKGLDVEGVVEVTSRRWVNSENSSGAKVPTVRAVRSGRLPLLLSATEREALSVKFGGEKHKS